MIQRVVENLNIEFDKNFKFIILCQEIDYLDYDFTIFNKMIGHDNIEIVKLKGITEGAACTLLTAKEFIDNKVPLLSFNSDQMIDYDPNETYSRLSLHDGGMPCFKGEGPKWSMLRQMKMDMLLR